MTRQHERLYVIFIHGLFSEPDVWADFCRLIKEDPVLADFVTTVCFPYDSPRFTLHPSRRIGDVDDIADQLATFLDSQEWKAEPIVVVTHSQGGLVAQRFLVRTLHRHQGLRLANIRQVVMYACPNRGSEFFLLARRLARFMRFLRSPQERQLEPYEKSLAETQQALQLLVLGATDNTETRCHVPIVAYGGTADKIVPPHEARGIFPIHGTLPGNHSSIIRAADHDADAYRVLRNALVAAAAESHPAPDDRVAIEDRRKSVTVTPPYEDRLTSLHGRGPLIAKVTGDRNHRVHVLGGPGGSGKSRLALEIAHQEKSRRRVWWVEQSRLNSGMKSVALQLGAPPTEVDQAWQDTASAADLLWRLLDASTSPWLLVIDNADEPQRLSLPGGAVSDGTGWLRRPAGEDGMVVVTSLDRREATWGDWCPVHRIEPLSDTDGGYLLMDRAGKGAGSFEAARALSVQLGGLPFALGQAGDHLRSVIGSRVFLGTDAIRDFESFRLAVKRRFESPAGARDEDDDFAWLQAVRSVASISLDLLGSRGFTEAAPLLEVFACLAISPIPYHVLLSTNAVNESPLFTEFTDARRLSVLEALDDVGLVEFSRQRHVDSPAAHVLTLHPVVHGLLRKDENVQVQRDDYYGLNVRMMLEATTDADPDEPANWSLWSSVAPHAIEICRAGLLDATPLTDTSVIADCLELARLTARYLHATALLVPAHQLVQDLVDGCDRFGFARTDRQVLGLRHELGRIDIERGNPAAAERELAEVVRLRAAIHGYNHADTLASRHKHARAILDQDRWPEAEKLLRAIVAAEHLVRPPNHKDTLVVRHSHARAVLALGRAVEAERMLREILDIYESNSPASASSEASRVWSTLGRALIAQERYPEAEESLRRALERTSNSSETTGAFWVRWVLSEVLLLQGRVPESIRELEALETDQKKVLGSTHPDTSRTSTLLADARLIPNGG